ncbi:MAG: MFS transporter [Ilumatobacter sp.]|uniref:MFS transporter n=1 Tax=Ilumatobacter sp. TaxID=1967498 RepID=UPI00391AB265
MRTGGSTLTRSWPNDEEHRQRLGAERRDLLDEIEVTDERRADTADTANTADTAEHAITGGARVEGEVDNHLRRFHQRHGPFVQYERTLDASGDRLIERTSYRLNIPWFGWLFRRPARLVLARKISHRGWWAPPDQLDATQLLVIGLLAAASMSAAFVNTLFTQTVEFAADDFGVGNTGIGIAGAIVRAGIVVALPAAVLADRIGRRRVVLVVAWLGPLLCLLGAVAPNFATLVATQTFGRPMGIALAFLVGVIAAEEMPRSSRAYAVSVLAMASGFGAGIAVMSLRLADIGESGWRLVYLVAAIWCVVALDLARRLPETRRFAAESARTDRPKKAPRLDRKRFALLAAVAFMGNIFISPASFFQNSYLDDVRGFSAGMIGLFSIAVGTPAGIGLIVGGRIADRRGRRRLISIALPLSVASIVAAFYVGGIWLWLFSLLGGILGSAVFPAMAVYRAELFPTANRTRAAGFVTAFALVGGIGGLIATGHLIDSGWSYGSVMALMSIGQVVVTVLVVAAYPETAHTELEDLNPEDHPIDLDTPR